MKKFKIVLVYTANAGPVSSVENLEQEVSVYEMEDAYKIAVKGRDSLKDRLSDKFKEATITVAIASIFEIK